MKTQITEHELAILDAVAVAAEQLRLAQESLQAAIERLLLVDECEEGHAETIERYVRAGGDTPIEDLLGELGIDVVDPLGKS
jgi:hypothetical protein